MIYDTENFFREMTAILKANLGAEITEVNTEKGDFELDTIHTDAWYIDEIPKNPSYTPYMFYGIDSATTIDTNEVCSLRNISIDYEVIVPDDGDVQSETENIYYKMLRYSRALESTVQKNADKIPSYVSVTVGSLLPVKIRIKGKLLHSVGIKVTASITSN